MSPNHSSHAFTLIELLIVILIIAILIAIAAPTFLNQQDKAKVSSTQQELSVVRQDLKALWTSNQGYPTTLGSQATSTSGDTTLVGQLEANEPQYHFDDLANTSTSTVGLALPANSSQPGYGNEAEACLQTNASNHAIYCLVTNEETGLGQLSETSSPSLLGDLLGQNQAQAATGLTEVDEFIASNTSAAQCAANYIFAVQPGTAVPISTDCNTSGTVQAGWSGAVTGSVSQSAAPSSNGSPIITGTAKEGQTLSVSQGSFTGSNLNYTYQWQSCNSAGQSCSNISSATTSSYTLQASDVDNTVQAIVTATNSSGAASATSAQTGAIAAGNAPAESTLPVLSGYAQDGQTMMTTTGSWTGDGARVYTYQWQRCTGAGSGCSNISGATSASYVIPNGSSGAYYQAIVTAKSSGGATAATSSNNSGAVAMSYDEVLLNPPSNSVAPFAMWDFNSGSLVDPISGQGSISENSGVSSSSGPFNNPVYQGLAFSGSASSYATLPDANTTDCSNTTARIPASDTSQGEPTGCVENATSFEVWFKTTSDGVLLSQTNSPYPDTTVNGAVPNLYVGTDGHLYAAIWQYNVLQSNNAVNDGNWHDAIFSTVGATGYLYIDGVLQSATSSGSWSNAYGMTTSALGVGDTSPSSYWTNGNNGYFLYTGDLGPIALSSYYSQFTASEALAHYNAMNPANYTIH